MIENTIAAARSSGARILLPGTIYNYGQNAFPVLREDSPQTATTHKGKIRIALEKKLEDATRDGVRVLIVRFGDFFGPKQGNSWFSQGMVKPHTPISSVTDPGKRAGPRLGLSARCWRNLRSVDGPGTGTSGFRSLPFSRILGPGWCSDHRGNTPGGKQTITTRQVAAMVHLQSGVALQ